MNPLQMAARAAVTFALPPRCASCGAIVAGDHLLCAPCWGSLTFLTDPGCLLCGIPLTLAGQVCGRCLAKPPDHDGVRAVVSYDDVARAIIMKLKHGRRIGLATMIGGLLKRHLPDGDIVLVPVPLHRWRIWHRGYNQSALIANALAKFRGDPVALDSLQRCKSTPLLRGLGPQQRTLTMRGAFRVDPVRQAMFRGAVVVLIDDVYTTGATANACARALKKAGASAVILLCWARVLRDEKQFD